MSNQKKLYMVICDLDPVAYLPEGKKTLVFGSPIYEHTYRKIKDASNKLGLDVEFVRASACDIPNTKTRISPAFDDIVVFASPLGFLASNKDIEGAIDYVVKSDVGYATVGSLRSLYLSVGQGKMLTDGEITSCAGLVASINASGSKTFPSHFADSEKSVPASKLDFYKKIDTYRHEMLDYLVMSGVEIESREGVFVSPVTEIHRGVKLLTGSIIKDGSKIGEGAVIGPSSYIECSEIGEGAHVVQSRIINSSIEHNAKVGPYSSLNDKCHILTEAIVGSFCELRGTTVSTGSIVSSHCVLSYTDIDQKCLIGSGVVTVDFESKSKSNRVKIGMGTVIGSNSTLISPINIGMNAFIGAGSTITDDVPHGALGIAREYQSNHDGWAKRNSNSKY
ncbi:MAG: hypothetical protein IJ400_05100 [Clostridia bacterium]|nr:hypothetical protein [Clostridia bacterium]